MRKGTAPCVGGPLDGLEHDIDSDEFPATAFGRAPGARAESGLYRYDPTAIVYRWEPAGVHRTRPDAEQLVREGDDAVYEGDLQSAKSRYGWAIDAFLELGDYEAAAQTCRKIIRVAPEVARARFTLAFLLIGQGQLFEARKHLVWYADAVRATEVADFALPRLQLLAHATSDAPTRDLILTLIADLGGTLAPTADRAAGFDGAARWERVLNTVLRDSLK